MEESRISPRTVYVGIVLFLALLVGLYFVYQIYQIILAFLLTVLFSLILSGPVNFLADRGLPRTLSTLVVVGALAGAAWLFGMLLASTVRRQFDRLAEDVPVLLEDVIALPNQALSLVGLEDRFQLDPGSIVEAGQDFLTGGMLPAVAEVGTNLVAAVTLGLVVLVATVYLVAQPHTALRGFVLLFPAERRERVREVLGKLGHVIKRWLLGQLVAMTFIGVSSAVALYLIGIPFAILLGIFGGLVSFVPLLGAIVSALPPVLLALVSDPILAVWVIVAYTAIQQVESQLIQPIVMSQAVKLHPALVLFAIVIMGTLFGFVGVLLAVPLVAAVQVLVNELWVARMNRVGEDPTPSPQEEGKSSLPRTLERALKALRISR